MNAFAIGDSVEHRFSITQPEMEAFARLSGDRSAVHWNDEFARSSGFERAIVYGGIMLARVSFVLGTMIPGDRGVSLTWSIRYHRPLYTDEPALLRYEVVDFSPATRLLSGKFEIRVDDRLVASGTTQSLVAKQD